MVNRKKLEDTTNTISFSDLRGVVKHMKYLHDMDRNQRRNCYHNWKTRKDSKLFNEIWYGYYIFNVLKGNEESFDMHFGEEDCPFQSQYEYPLGPTQ